MSYDIRLEGVEFTEPHYRTGGTYQLGGTRQAWLNCTYNYSKHFYRVFQARDPFPTDNPDNIRDGKVGGIRSIYGLTAEESLPVLHNAISQLGDDVSPNYWDATEGNAKAALTDLVFIAQQAIDEGFGFAKWIGD